MAGYLICLTSGSGIPVFTRSVGNVKPLPFPVIGSLNAVHMFAANQNACLKSTTTEDARIVWEEFNDSVVLISVLGKDTATKDDVTSAQLLRHAFHSMVLLYGLEDLTSIKNVERFKREIKISYQLVDALLLQASSPLFVDLTQAVDVILAPEATAMQTFLEAFSEAAGSPYGCLLVHGRILVATRKWWELSPTALTLMQLLTFTFSPCSSRDVPIYIPHLSPSVPHRLLTFELLPHIQVCVICGPTPSLTELEREIGRFWVPAVDSLRSVRQTYPRNFPWGVDLDGNILGFLLINKKTKQCLSSVSMTKEQEDPARVEKRRSVLRSFYKHVMGAYFNGEGVEDDQTEGPSEFTHQTTDTYIVCPGYKCYALTDGPHHMFVLYTSKIPTFSMRSVTQKTLYAFTKDKTFHI